jgi:hypothetical protein
LRAAIRRFHSPDCDLATFRPDDPDTVGLLVQLLIGPDGGSGEESFDVIVCTPNWLAQRTADGVPIIGRHHLVVHRYDWPIIERFLRHHVSAIEGGTWSEVAARLSRLGRWEFEDYGGVPSSEGTAP